MIAICPHSQAKPGSRKDNSEISPKYVDDVASDVSAGL